MSASWNEVVGVLRLDVLSAVLLSILLGGSIGLERELKGKAAGLRTNILICMGAALFTQVGMSMAGSTPDKSRIAAQIVTGVGFLGAGTILHGKGTISGLTSAATIWLVAAIGCAVGAGEIAMASGATLITIFVLGGLGRVEDYIRRTSRISKVTVEVDAGPNRVDDIQLLAQQAGVHVDDIHHEIIGDKIRVDVTLRGPQRAQDQAKLALLRATGAYTLQVQDEE